MLPPGLFALIVAMIGVGAGAFVFAEIADDVVDVDDFESFELSIAQFSISDELCAGGL